LLAATGDISRFASPEKLVSARLGSESRATDWGRLPCRAGCDGSVGPANLTTPPVHQGGPWWHWWISWDRA